MGYVSCIGIFFPVPVVPFTLQFLFTTLAGLLLGSKKGAISVVAYMILGLAGLPIFSEGGGFWYVIKPSFGYIIGFCIGTYVTGLIADRERNSEDDCLFPLYQSCSEYSSGSRKSTSDQ